MPAYVVQSTHARSARNGVTLCGAKVLVRGIAYNRRRSTTCADRALAGGHRKAWRQAGRRCSTTIPSSPEVGRGTPL